MGKHTRVPEILDQLVSLIKAQPEIDAKQVVDGAASLNDYANYVVFVGFRPNSDEWVSVSRAAPRGLAANDEETVTIGILIAATDPTHDMSAARTLVAGKVAAVERIVTEDMKLGLGAGTTTSITALAWQPLHTAKGAECNVSMDIQVKVLL